MVLVWIILILHFIYYLPFLITFSAFVRTVSGKKNMYLGIALWFFILMLDFFLLYINFNSHFLFYYLIVCYLVPLINTLILWLCGKLDVSIWLLYTIIFSPVSMPFAFLFVYFVTPKSRLS
ncbi:MAG TPA: hypothetical protein DD381_02545 [Lentisphaeria bacterium]|nr:MAG: hypothetical protein A2X47_03705 [Lentisphaerae bacterium GWF2_38_69]HBM15214.1 hypothetical protein [Lentisphaeria bacterium]